MVSNVIVSFGISTELSWQNILHFHKGNIDTRSSTRRNIN